MRGAILEICVDDSAGLDAAVAGGADRIELCAGLALGGLTPTPGLVARAARCSVPVYAMIRSRSGDFVFSDAEIAGMEADIDHVRAAGLAGVVLGASQADGRLDAAVLRRLISRAGGLGLTLHRAFDLVPDLDEAVETAIDLGFDRILTSGGARTAMEGIARLEAIVGCAGNRIAIMPGSGVTADNAPLLMDRLGVREIHASGSAPIGPVAGAAVELGFESPERKRTSTEAVRALKAAIGKV